MKILFDYYEISKTKGKSIGIYEYSMQILKNFPKEVDVTVACNGENIDEIIKVNDHINTILISKKYPNILQRIYWRYFYAIRLCKKKGIDIYYSTKGFAPGLKQRNSRPYIVLTIHDMIPFYYLENYPRYFGKIENIIITRSLKRSANIANKVITISEYSKKMILKYAIKSDVEVIYRGFNMKAETLSKKLPYIFAITSKLPHKNKDNLIAGYIKYANNTNDPLRLKVCGITRNDIVIPPEHNEYIDFLGYVDDSEKDRLYSNSMFFMFLPHVEGLGLPPYEALAYNKISILSDIPVFKEGLEDIMYYVDQTDPNAIAEAIKYVHHSINNLDKRIQKGKDIIESRFDWGKCISNTIDVFKKIIRVNI